MDETEFQRRLQYVDMHIKDRSNMLTDIYLITNIITQKRYVGQSNTHRLNNGLLRVFGYKKRLLDHISEALCNTKKKQCTKLNNSIRKHGSNNFKVELIERCFPELANEREQYWILEYNTMAPAGYNLSEGGRKGATTLAQRIKIMHSTIKQFEASKLDKYKDVKIDKDKIDTYLKRYTSYNKVYYCIRIQGIKSIFASKHMTEDELKQQALDFLRTLCERQTCSKTSKLRETP